MNLVDARETHYNKVIVVTTYNPIYLLHSI